MSIRVAVGPTQHPALRSHMEQRAQNTQNRIADAMTAFAGSMVFVYLHDLSNRILDLTRAIHVLTVAHEGAGTGAVRPGEPSPPA